MTQAPRALPVLLVLLVAAAAPAGQEWQSSPAAWRTFEGSWSASGQRQMLPMGGGRQAATLQLSGAIVLTSGEGLSHGFRGEFIGFDDGASLSVGRAVWTDEHGDRIFSELKGETVLREGRRITGTITGGTGRYAGLEGDYTFVWQFLVAGEGDTIQGRSVDLKGRVRVREAGR
jgi:hypothetical protein